MVDCYTPNYAADIDKIAPTLAGFDIASAILWWLHSRAFVSKNKIRVSQSTLAKIFDVSECGINRAVKALKEKGLISVRTRRGGFGGSVFSLTGFPSLQNYIKDGRDLETERNSRAKSATSSDRIPAYLPSMSSSDAGNNSCLHATAIPSCTLDNLNTKSNKKSNSKEKDFLSQVTKETMLYLNSKAGTDFSPDNPSYLSLIRKLIEHGYCLEDIQCVINAKCDDWLGTKMQSQLKPTTLFSLNHFDEYLNALRPVSKNGCEQDEQSEYSSL